MRTSLKTSKTYERLTKHEIVRQFVKYGVVGVLNVGIFFAIYLGLRLADVSTLWSQAPAFFVTSVISFALNKAWSFRDPRRHAVVRQYLGFVACTVAGFGIQRLLFTLFLIPLRDFDLLGEVLALGLALPVSVIWNFTAYRYVIFRDARAPSSS